MNTTPPRSPSSARGFTLIELLTVIAIIGILAAIIIPTVGSVRQTAREAQNKSNLRQIAMAMNVYANDNKDKFLTTVSKYNGVDRDWKLVLNQFLTNGSITGSNKESVFSSPTRAIQDTGTSTLPCHYSLHQYLCSTAASAPGGAAGPAPYARGRVTRPSQVILVADGSQSEANGNAQPSFYAPNEVLYGNARPLTDFIPAEAAQNTDDGAGRGRLRYRNRDSVHAAMVDGSVRGFKRGTVTYGNIVPYQ